MNHTVEWAEKIQISTLSPDIRLVQLSYTQNMKSLRPLWALLNEVSAVLEAENPRSPNGFNMDIHKILSTS